MKAIFHKFLAYKSRRLWLDRMNDKRFVAFLLDEKEYSRRAIIYHKLIMKWNPDNWIDHVGIMDIIDYDKELADERYREKRN